MATTSLSPSLLPSSMYLNDGFTLDDLLNNNDSDENVHSSQLVCSQNTVVSLVDDNNQSTAAAKKHQKAKKRSNSKVSKESRIAGDPKPPVRLKPSSNLHIIVEESLISPEWHEALNKDFKDTNNIANLHQTSSGNNPDMRRFHYLPLVTPLGNLSH